MTTQEILQGVHDWTNGKIVYDISAAHPDGQGNPTPYADLTAALGTGGVNIPEDIRKGGMSIKFIQGTINYTVVKTEGVTEEPTGTEIQNDPSIESGTYKANQLSAFSALPTTPNSSLTYYLAVTETVDEQEVTTYTTWVITYVQSSDNKYVQARCMTTSFSTTESDWQGVDDEPTAGSKNLVESGGTNNSIINTALIDVPRISGQDPDTLASALALVPSKYRKGLAIIYFRENGKPQIYGFVSFLPSDDNWNNTSYWVKFPNETEVVGYVNAEKIRAQGVEETLNTNLGIVSSSLEETSEIALNASCAIPAGKIFNNGNYDYYAYFNGEDSEVRFSPIAFTENGDYLEIEFKNVGNGDRLSAAQRESLANILLGVSPTSISVRGAQDTWIYLNNGTLSSKTSFKFKMLYDNGNIYIYRDEELLSTYTGQIDTYLSGFGKNSQWGYWQGGIGKIKITSADAGITDWEGYIHELPNITQNITSFASPNGFLTEEQAALLHNATTLPNTVVSYNASGIFYVYMRKPNTNIYFRLDLHHVIDNDELVYLNIWRLSGNGQLCRYENNQFVDLDKNLLLGVENEFTMHFDGAADFTGGYHGDERIDTEGSFVKFFVDGQELTSTQLSENFTKECNDFYMLSNATLHETSTDGETPIADHPVVARHIKKTIFKDCGFTCENRVDFLTSKNVSILFTGLVCVHKDCALNGYADDYVIQDVSTSQEVAVNIDDACKGEVCFYNNTTGLSCVVDSHAIGENDDNLFIRLQDRANDSKYYRYATNNGVRSVVNGDKYLSKVKVKWDYNIED